MSDSEDEDLQLAIAISLGKEPGECASAPPAQPSEGNNNEETGEVPAPSRSGTSANKQQNLSTINQGLSAMNRKQLEEERLARQAARKRQAAEAAGSNQSSFAEAREPKKSRLGGVLSATPRSQASTAAAHTMDTLPTPSSSQTVETSAPQYPNPTIKRTWAFGYDRNDDIKIEEVLRKNELQLCVLSTWQFETSWWYTKVDCEKTKQVWLIGPTDKDMEESFAAGPAMIPNLAVCFVDMKGVDKNHAKFMILGFPQYLRIVVTSANLTGYDWGETGVMENSVFLIDLPRLPGGQRADEDELTFFGKEFLSYLRYNKLGKSVTDSILKFDWSKTKDIAFVHSMGGIHTGSDIRRTGFPRLAEAVKKLNLQTVPETLQIDYATASLGALRRAFMRQLYLAASGEDVEDPLDGVAYDKDVNVDNVLEHFRIYFPTSETVKTSKGGPDNGGTIFFHRKFYSAPGFPKDSLRDHQSSRQGILSHNKILLARGQQLIGEGEEKGHQNIAWAYVGSANLSESAWGSLKTAGRGKNKTAKLECRNYEAGVLVPVPLKEINKAGSVTPGIVPGYEAFSGLLDIPFRTPGEKHGVRKPWFCMEEMSKG